MPCSTEQILHPERYDEVEQVQEISLPSLLSVLSNGWEEVQRDTLGELIIALHLAAYLEDESSAWTAADGWAGDIFSQWESEDKCKTGNNLKAARPLWGEGRVRLFFPRSLKTAPRIHSPQSCR